MPTVEPTGSAVYAGRPMTHGMQSWAIKRAGIWALAAAAVGVACTSHSASAQVVYQVDDGSASVNTAPIATGSQMLWGNVFTTQPGGELITEMQVAFGTITAGRDVSLVLMSDPNGDGNPADALPIRAQTPSTHL